MQALALFRMYERLVREGTFDDTLANLYEIGHMSGWQRKQDIEEVLLADQLAEEEDLLEVTSYSAYNHYD
jgi:hypothetical protein